ALHGFENAREEFPSDGWIPYMMPYIEQSTVAQEFWSGTDYWTAVGTKIPLLYCPSEPRGHVNYGSEPYSISLTWYVAGAGLDFNDSNIVVNIGFPWPGNSLPDSSRAGILTYTSTDFFDSSGNYLSSLPRRGAKISQVTDGLSNTVMIGERPPSPDLGWGWWR